MKDVFWAGVVLLALTTTATVCLGTAIGPPDANCDPTVDPPATGGCTWYGFIANTDGTITGGTSGFTNYSVAAPDPPWTFTTTGYTIFRVLDGGHQGDVFGVYNDGIYLGETSSTPIDATHSCANDPTGPGFDPAACWNDPLMSKGSFLLAPGTYSITVTWDQRVPGGPSDIQWFELADTTNPIPEPSTYMLFGAGLLGIALFGRQARLRSLSCRKQ